MKIRITKTPKWHNRMIKHEAERAREAFEALSPEEQVAVMENAARQEQAMAQEMAMAEQQAAMGQDGSVQDELGGETPSTVADEEAMMGQEPQMVAAEGGRLFDEGGYKGALEYLKKKFPNLSIHDSVARALAKRAKVVGYKNSDKNNAVYDWDKAYKDMHARNDKQLSESNEQLFNALVADGIPREIAFGMAYPKTLSYPFSGKKYSARHSADRDAAYKRLIADYMPPTKNEGSKTPINAQTNVVGSGTSKSNAFMSSPYETTLDKTATTESQAPATRRLSELSQQEKEAIRERALRAQQQPAVQAAQAVQRSTERPIVNEKPASISRGTTRSTDSGDLKKYDWYRNGSDGYSQPWGFTVGDNGLIDTETGYTDEYRKLVDSLNADQIREWAAQHPDDPSLASFRKRNKRADGKDPLSYLTTDQWRKGATDDKYGFMHHVTDQILKENSTKPSIVDELGIDTEALAKMEGESRAAVEKMMQTPQEEIPQTRSVAAEYGAPWAPENNPAGNVSVGESTGTGAGAGGTGGATRSGTGVQSVVDTQTGRRKIVPVLKNEDLRYAGLFGPAVGLGMMAAGIGKPDYSGLDAALESYDRAGTALADYQPLGNYLTYRPMDIWAEQNKLNANARATDRAIMNTAGPGRIAGLLASGYNNQLASGELYKKALEYNDALRKQVAEFNRGTDQFNAQAYNSNSQFNAGIRNQGKSTRANLAAQIAGQKMNADAGWYNSLYANVGNMFKGISDLGRENADRNWIARMAAAGYFPGLNPDNLMNAGLVKYADEADKLAYGGRIKKKKSKKRGFTI